MFKTTNRNELLALPLPVFNLSTSIFLITIATFCFLNSYNGDFVFDDSEAIVNNEDVQKTPIHQIFYNDFWGTKLSNKKSHKSYRPLTILSFRLQYWIEQKLNSVSFHIANVLLHTLFCILTFFIFQIFLDWKESQISFYATLLFAVHPIHTEAVSGIVGRADILSGLFMWSSMISYYKCVHSKFLITQCQYILLCIVNCTTAMFCKETGVTILVICIIYDLIIVNKIVPRDFLRVLRLEYSYTDVKKFINTNLFLFIRITVLILTSILLLLLRFRIMGFSTPEFKPVDNPASFVDNAFFRLLNYNYIYSLNLWLLICPDWLCFDWSMGCVPLINSIDLSTDPRIICIFVFWTLACVFGKFLFSENNKNLIRYTTMGLSLLVISFLPASNLFITVGFVVAERTLYIPSAGYCLLLVIGFKKLSMIVMCPKMMSVSFCALLLIFFTRSWIRSDQWKTETTLFQSGLRVCPLNAKVHYNVGKNAADQGMIDLAKFEYEEALRLNSNYSQAMNNLGNIYKSENNYQKAEKLLRDAVSIQHDFPAAWMNLGIVLSARSKYEEAEKCYFSAISHRATYPDCYYNLGLLYLSQKNYKGALNAWKIATNQKSTHQQAWTNMIILYENLKQPDEALKTAEKALLHNPEDPSIHFNLGNILGKKNLFEKAEFHFKKALSSNSKNSVYYTNLGVLYHRWNKYDKAETMYKKALELNPYSNTTMENLKRLNNARLQKDNE